MLFIGAAHSHITNTTLRGDPRNAGTHYSAELVEANADSVLLKDKTQDEYPVL